MGLFDSLKNTINNTANGAVNAVSGAAKTAIQNGSMKSETITFTSLPKSVEELKAMPQADLSTPFKTAALAIAALCCYNDNPEAACAMTDFLRGPRPLSPHEKQFLKDRLIGKQYKTFSFFAGSSPKNNYTPSQPYAITVSEYAYSYTNEGYAMLNIISSGADSPRQIQLRKKESTGQWFLWENYALSDIRIPENQDPWA